MLRGLLRGQVAGCLASFRADIARPCPAQGKLSCQSSGRMFGGIAVATVRPLPGRCADMTRDISSDFLPDGSRPSRDRLAGLRAVFGELLASRKILTKLRGKASLVLNSNSMT